MAIYKMDCSKCTNVYTGFMDGKFNRWCKPMVDGINPLRWEWHDEDKKKDTCHCDYYTTGQSQAELRLV